MPYQKNLEGDNVPDWVYDYQHLKNNEVKLYKKCSRVGCKNDVSNKERSYLCVDCMLDMAIYNKSIVNYL